MKRFLFIVCVFILWELSAEVGDTAPSAFVLPNLQTNEHLLFREYLAENKVILNFFASYCVPCKAEITEIQKLALKYPKVKLLFINVDEKSDIQKVELLASEWNIHYPILLDPYHVAVSQYVKPRLAIPATIIIDAKGKIYFESIGYDKKTIPRIEKVLRKL